MASSTWRSPVSRWEKSSPACTVVRNGRGWPPGRSDSHRAPEIAACRTYVTRGRNTQAGMASSSAQMSMPRTTCRVFGQRCRTRARVIVRARCAAKKLL